MKLEHSHGVGEIRVRESHMAVVAGEPGGDGEAFSAARLEFQGTAFAIAPGVFLTASHVLESALRFGTISIARLSKSAHVVPVTEIQLFPEVDLGIAFANLTADVLPLDFRPLSFGEPVSCLGWAQGPDPEFFTFVPRHFWGTVVTRRTIFQVGGRELSGQPAGYELSFGVPGGLSGAPLISHVSGKVTGIAVGTLTHAQDEVVRQLGIAVDVVELLRLRCSKVGQLSELFGLEPLAPRPPIPKVRRNPDGSMTREEAKIVVDEGWPEV